MKLFSKCFIKCVWQERIQKAQAEQRKSQAQESQGSVEPTAPLKAGLGLVEHPRYCRGLGLGARPSIVYGRSTAFEASYKYPKFWA